MYTVYLFSSQSQENADRLNQKLRDAGHPTEIIVSDDGETVRYRVAGTGFGTRQAAQQFSDSVVGKHGIRDSWIGRSKLTE